jgi:hypothetical protein
MLQTRRPNTSSTSDCRAVGFTIVPSSNHRPPRRPAARVRRLPRRNVRAAEVDATGATSGKNLTSIAAEMPPNG